MRRKNISGNQIYRKRKQAFLGATETLKQLQWKVTTVKAFLFWWACPVWLFEWECSLQALALEHMVPSWCCCLERLRRYGIAGGYMSLGSMSLRFQSLLTLCSLCLLLGVQTVNSHWFLPPCLSMVMFIRYGDDRLLTLWNCKLKTIPSFLGHGVLLQQ
jgi:hypothetical protein